MTGYHISIGYNASRVNSDDMWETLKARARQICDDPHAIIDEARRLGSPENCPHGCCPLDSYADNYADPFGTYGHPVVIVDNGEGDQEIVQFASAGDDIKYHVRRAFVRLLLEAMHKDAIEVSVVVC